jgi:hypothetical protein
LLGRPRIHKHYVTVPLCCVIAYLVVTCNHLYISCNENAYETKLFPLGIECGDYQVLTDLLLCVFDGDVNKAWENIKESIKTSAKESLGLHELKLHKPWFDKECLGFLDQRKQAKMQWIQDPSQSNVGNLNNVRRDASRHFRNNKKAYLKAKIQELETNSTINYIRDLYRGINDFKKGWWNYFSQLLNVHGAKEVRQAEVHTAEPLVPEPSAFEVELAIEKLKRHKSPGIDQIPTELIKTGGRTILFYLE